MLKNSDEAIDKVMAGLRDVAPSPGMEQRILRAIQDRAAAPSIRRRFAVTAVAACVLLAALIVVARISFVAHPTAPSRPAQSAAMEPSHPAQAVTATTTAAPLPGAHSAKRLAKRETNVNEAPAQETAVSYPAPPMPLTEQERLLLRLAHRRDPANLAMLNPTAQATEIAAEQAQFEEFFAPPPPIQAEAPIPTEVKHEGESR